jgi:hypothetical protein
MSLTELSGVSELSAATQLSNTLSQMISFSLVDKYGRHLTRGSKNEQMSSISVLSVYLKLNLPTYTNSSQQLY